MDNSFFGRLGRSWIWHVLYGLWIVDGFGAIFSAVEHPGLAGVWLIVLGVMQFGMARQVHGHFGRAGGDPV